MAGFVYYISTVREFSYDWRGNLVLGVFFLYCYLSIKLSKKVFYGPPNVDAVVPKYAANGLEYWAFTMALYTALSFSTDLASYITYLFPSILISLNNFALLFCLYLWFIGRNSLTIKKIQEPKYSNFFFQYYRGMEFHARIFDMDVKQFTNCRFSMMAWNLLVLNFTLDSYFQHGFNAAISINCLLQSVYLLKFFYWETGYFNTLDITLDRCGFYICWGVLVWVPSFYTFSTYFMLINPP